jgi:hypothetical protein
MALGVFAGGEVGFNDVLDEIGGGDRFCFFSGMVGAAHDKTSHFNHAILTG